MRLTLAEQLWKWVDEADDCWEWVGAKNKYGYGILSVAVSPDAHGGVRRNMRAHRVSWIVHHGDIPSGLNVLHRCDNRACVRPDHLFLGTQRDNFEDMVAKGRAARPFVKRAA